VTESSSKDPKKSGGPGSDEADSPLKDLISDVLASELGPEAKAEPAPEEREQAPIVLDMEEEPFVLEVGEAAPTRPEPEPPPAAKAPAPVPAVIIDDAPLAPSAAEEPAAAKPAPVKPASEKKAQPDYTSDLPSMVPPGVRDRFSPPPPAPSLAAIAARPRSFPRAGPAVPRAALVALATAALAGGALWLYLHLRPAAPVIASVTPPKAEPGQTVTIAGSGFDPDADDNAVRFGEQPGKVTSASETQLAVTVPESLDVADAGVRVQTRGGRSNALFLKIYRGPRVTSVDPPVALPGAEVVLRGSNLAGPSLAVEVGGLPAAVKDSSPAALRVRVPDLPLLEGRPVAVTVEVAGATGRPAEIILGRLPLVTQLSPASGPPGTQVAVRGHGFDPDVRANRVTIGGAPALLLSATANEIAAIVPAPASAGSQVQAPVVVQARGGTSSGGVSFVVMSPSEASFRPHYFPAAAADRPAEDVALVSTELGPALLLGGKADAPSTAERAARAAAALNAAVEAAGSGPATLEARDKPVTGVALAGSPSLLVAATPEDAAAYAREPSARGQRATPRALAEFWAALLQDHLTLFVQRQRPLRVVELSPRGKVLLDLFSEAERRGGAGAGVSTRLVRPLTPSLARSFRELALVLPSGPSTAAAAVAGRWEGTMQETAAASRGITIELRLDGTRLSGTLTTRSRAVAMAVPLKDIRYEKGRLAFVTATGGALHEWSGAVEGTVIEGTIREGTKDVGGFSLRYSE
jgi:IPT/TIG domain-containing protein